MEVLFESDQFVDLALQESGDRDARPAGDHLGDVLLVHFFLEHAEPGLELLE